MSRFPVGMILVSVGLVTYPGFAAAAAPGDVVIFIPHVECPHLKIDDAGLQATYEDLWSAYLEASDQTVEAVNKKLGELLADAQEAGNLDLAVFWDGLKKTFSNTGRLEWETVKQRADWKRFGKAEFPRELAAFLAQCRTDYEATRDVLLSGYQKLEQDVTKAGTLTQAAAVRKEWDSIRLATKSPIEEERSALSGLPPKPGPQRPDPVIGLWGRPEQWAIEFRADGKTQSFFNGKLESEGVWRVEGDGKYSATSGPRWRHEVVIRGKEIEKTSYLDGKLKSTGKLQRTR